MNEDNKLFLINKLWNYELSLWALFATFVVWVTRHLHHSVFHIWFVLIFISLRLFLRVIKRLELALVLLLIIDKNGFYSRRFGTSTTILETFVKLRLGWLLLGVSEIFGESEFRVLWRFLLFRESNLFFEILE
jgi:hypothetical protein